MIDQAAPRRIAAFGEDSAHRTVIGALINRVAGEVGLAVSVDWRSATRGHGQVVSELTRYFRDLKRQGGLPDLVVIGTDANCKGYAGRRAQLPLDACPVPAVVAIPDPHIERWLLLDGGACRAALGHGCQAPDHKCARDRYKEALIRTVLAAKKTPNLGAVQLPFLG